MGNLGPFWGKKGKEGTAVIQGRKKFTERDFRAGLGGEEVKKHELRVDGGEKKVKKGNFRRLRGEKG